MLLRTILLSICLGSSVFAAEVIDGDTIRQDGITYRINGIDAPEVDQRCLIGSKKWQCGRTATAAMAALVENKRVVCEAHTNDGRGREVATCRVDGRDIGQEMIRQGLAFAFVRYSDVYVADEMIARSDRIGIWASKVQPPWEYRAAKWKVAEQKAPEGCPIKGNISRNGQIYHPPWSPWYNRTKISPSKGEKWFCSEDEAVAAGWRAPVWR